ncbi:MAG TPA: HAMP domain-containing sensor histidine kinase [Vicinamibacterales bacterium]
MTNRNDAEDETPTGARSVERDAVSASDASQKCTPEALVALSRAVTTARLLSGVVHEVNNALLVITGTVELLEGRSDLPDAVDRPLERLRTQSHRMAAAIAQVAAFTQAQLGDRADVDLGELARVAVDLRRFAVTRAGLTIQFTVGSHPCLVRGNGAELQQAILNLIINAEHALAGTRGQIDVEATKSDGWATVRVSDSRPGPLPDSHELFEPFVPTRAPADTSGLNLFAARAIAAAHGGTLAVDENGTGTSFIVRVPELTSIRR